MNKNHLYAMLYVLQCLAGTVYAQSLSKIEGYVYSAYGNPIENAEVVVADGVSGTVTDTRGFFRIQNLFAGEYTITASHIGYQTQIRENVLVKKDLPVFIVFRLRPAIGETEEITVTARREPVSVISSTILLTEDLIQRSSAQSLGDLLAQIPGITIIDDGGTQKKISIRGSNPNQVLVTLDGMALNDPLTGEADLNTIPLSVIGEVIIHKGISAAQAGQGAVAGRVEIRSRKIFADLADLTLKGGSYGARGIRMGLSGTGISLGGLASFEYLEQQGNYPYTYEELDGSRVQARRLNAGNTARQWFIKTSFTQDRHTLIFQANVYRSERGLPGTVFFWTPYATAAVSRDQFSASYSSVFDRIDVSVQLSAYRNRSDYRNLWTADPPLMYRRVPPYSTDYTIKKYQGDLQAGWHWSENSIMNVSVSYGQDLFNDEDRLNPATGPVSETDNSQTTISVENIQRFSGQEWLNRSAIRVWARYENAYIRNQSTRRHDTFFSPGTELTIGFENSWLWILQAGYGRSFRLPTFADLFYQDFRVRGNAGLLPEKSEQIQLTSRIKLPWVQNPEFAVTYHRQNVSNLIVWELGSFSTWQPVNTDAFIEGWEYEFFWTPLPEYVDVLINHQYLNSRDRGDQKTTYDQYLTYRPAHITRIHLNAGYGPVSVGYQRQIVSERFVTPANTVTLPGYQVDDLSLNFETIPDFVQGKFSIMISNLWNTRYVIVRDAPLPGRQVRMSLNLTI